MNKWTPISEAELFEEIQRTEFELNSELWNFWQLIKIDPIKWEEPKFGKEGEGFWVVAICGYWVIWYNDIEEGFNISNYKRFGQIDGYFCNQDQLNWAVRRMYDLIKFGGDLTGQAGPPKPL